MWSKHSAWNHWKTVKNIKIKVMVRYGWNTIWYMVWYDESM